jgi:hypothetical protein
MDYLVSKMMANDLLLLHITRVMNQQEDLQPLHTSKAERLSWTAKDVGFYELVYFIWANDWINGGHASITSIARALGTVLNKKVDNISKKLEEIRLRKKDRMPLINLGVVRFLQRMEEDDLKAR